jgi:hypothetical protein
MRIIKRGKPPAEVKWEGTCGQCSSVIEAKADEIQVEWDQRETGSYGRANCPVCGVGMVFYPQK